jgi:hypothetical protein
MLASITGAAALFRATEDISILGLSYGTENVTLTLNTTTTTGCHHECSVCFELSSLLWAHLL